MCSYITKLDLLADHPPDLPSMFLGDVQWLLRPATAMVPRGHWGPNGKALIKPLILKDEDLNETKSFDVGHPGLNIHVKSYQKTQFWKINKKPIFQITNRYFQVSGTYKQIYSHM